MSKINHCPREVEPTQNNPDIKNLTATDTWSSQEVNLSLKKIPILFIKKKTKRSHDFRIIKIQLKRVHPLHPTALWSKPGRRQSTLPYGCWGAVFLLSQLFTVLLPAKPNSSLSLSPCLSLSLLTACSSSPLLPPSFLKHCRWLVLWQCH